MKKPRHSRGFFIYGHLVCYGIVHPRPFMRLLLLPLLSSALAFLHPSAPQPPQNLDTGKVRQVQGKYVFFHNQPVAAYDVAFSFNSTYTPSMTMTLNDIVSGCITGAFTEAGSQLKPFDAIVLQPSGTRDIAIKFKDSVPQAERALATVTRQSGKYMFEFCEPINDYQVIKTEKPAWYNKLFGGAYYSSTQVESNLAKSAQKNPAVQAIVFNETASFVSFK